MNRRALLRGLLAIPVVAALAPLLTKAIVPDDDGDQVISVATNPIRYRVITGMSWYSGDAVGILTLTVNGGGGSTDLLTYQIVPGQYGDFVFAYPVVILPGAKVSTRFDVTAGGSYDPPVCRWYESLV